MLDCRWIDHAENASAKECTAARHLALYPDAAAHHLHQPPTDCQSETRAAVFAGGGSVGLAEGLEDETLLVGGNADAGILHGEA
jgi:hypothetical protein